MVAAVEAKGMVPQDLRGRYVRKCVRSTLTHEAREVLDIVCGKRTSSYSNDTQEMLTMGTGNSRQNIVTDFFNLRL